MKWGWEGVIAILFDDCQCTISRQTVHVFKEDDEAGSQVLQESPVFRQQLPDAHNLPQVAQISFASGRTTLSK